MFHERRTAPKYEEIYKYSCEPLKDLEFTVIKLDMDRRYYNEIVDENRIAILINIKGEVSVNHENGGCALGFKENIYDSNPTAYVFTKLRKFNLKGVKDNSEVAFITYKDTSEREDDYFYIYSSLTESRVVGKGNYERVVTDIINYNITDKRIKNIRIGQTCSKNGNWSSFPPHRHSFNSKDEVKMEELYYYRFYPEQGFGFQAIYDDKNSERAYIIRNEDVCYIKSGYHPVVAAPGYQFYYLWILIGDDCSEMKLKEEDDHKWLNKK